MGRNDRPDVRNALPADLVFYASPPHDCSYLHGRQAVTLFADPRAAMNNTIYGALAAYGFRRSGEYVYRPRCPGCNACQSARIPVRSFAADRSQRRTWEINADLEVRRLSPAFSDEHYQLYRHYISSRHPGGGMDVDEPERYLEFLGSRWCSTEFIEFRHDGRLLAVAVVDTLQDGLSAVYTYFDVAERRRSLGTYAVLWQVEEARRRGLDYVYLGYYIAQSPKMSYKGRFQPLEIFSGGVWQRMADAPADTRP